MTADRWPIATLGPVSRMAVLAEALPGAHWAERRVPAKFDAVWGYLCDLERSIPDLDETVAQLRITRRSGEHLEARAHTTGRLRLGATFDIELRPGWCWMVARPGLYLVGFAAEPDGDRTRLGHLEALHVPGPATLRRIAQPVLALSRRRIARHVERDLDAIEKALGR